MDGDRLAPVADLVTAVDVEHARLAEERARSLAGGSDERADLDVLVDGDGDVLEDRGDT